ncbi:AAA family ATPase [Metabacillus schmidteae]|uniref:AAA family ATPase n=1 Tax=Metabacillus schmidteae TaxID=2730405 RepID=UPI00158ED8E3|nr:ATP-binding protein [Metabacillus schmidteae]
MKRLVIITVGKTHSGKTTFAKALELQLNDSLVIDQDNHAEFINSFYKSIVPKQGPNTLKYAITQTIVDYAVNEANNHLILCNANRNQKGRLDLLEHFHNKGFVSIIVNFDIPDQVLRERVEKSQRSTSIFRSASSFMEVLARQQSEYDNWDVIAPKEGEADHLFLIKDNEEIKTVIQRIVSIARNS